MNLVDSHITCFGARSLKICQWQASKLHRRLVRLCLSERPLTAPILWHALTPHAEAPFPVERCMSQSCVSRPLTNSTHHCSYML